jgi:predicted DNA-binding transcriptional regulator AlpA
MTATDGVDNYFSTRQAASYLGISESWLRQRRMVGNLYGQRPGPPFVRLGRAVRYCKPVLDRWLTQQSVVLCKGD